MSTLVEDVQRLTAIDLTRCRACESCRAAFPVREALDLSPAELVRRVLDDDRETVFKSRTLWLLSGCAGRRVVCGEGVALGRALAALRKLALDSDVTPAEPGVRRFIEVVFDQLRTHGRIHLRGLLREMRKSLPEPATEESQEIAMLFRKKLRLRPESVLEVEEVADALEGDGGEDET